VSMSYIRKIYGVPARRGGRVEYTGGKDGPKLGTITYANGQYLMIRLDGSQTSATFHPTWELRYLDASQPPAHRGDPGQK
jgi:hypothetical protein